MTYFNCNYMKACLVEINRDIHSSKIQEKYELFAKKFHHVNIIKKCFMKRQKIFTVNLKKKKWNVDDKEDFLEIYGGKMWDNLNSEEKIKHDFHCLKCSSHEFFPALINVKTNPTKSVDVVNENFTQKKLTVTLPVTTTKGVQKEVAKNVLREIDNQWDVMFKGSTFIETITKIPETKLKIRDSASTQRKKRRKEHQKIKQSIEKSMALEGKDADVFYGIRQSKSMYEKQRLSLYFEDKKSAVERTKARK